MKLILTTLLLSVLLGGCTSPPTEESPPTQPDDGDAPVGQLYTNQAFRYTLNLPQELAEACTVRENEDSTVIFELNESGDYVLSVEVVTPQEWETQGSNLGTIYLGETETQTFYIQLPTCGTLNEERLRNTWEHLTELASNLGPQDFVLLPAN